jgi:hypothetical protein
MMETVTRMMRQLVIFALLASASLAQAKIGETKEQIIRRFGAAAMTGRDDKNCSMEFTGKNYVVVIFDTAGRSVFELYQLKSAYSVSDANEIVKTVLGGVRWRWIKVAANLTRSADGVYSIAEIPPAGLFQWGIAVGHSEAVNVFYRAMMASSRPTPPPVPTPNEFDFVPDATPAVDTARRPNDCAIVAAQAYARLKPVTYWCQVAAMKGIWRDGASGHALVLFKYQADGNVFVYDEQGSRPLPTSSENLAEIKPVLQSVTPDCAIQAMAYLTH